MRKLLLAAMLFAAVPATAKAQIQAQIQLQLPAAPPMVVIRPGVEVVEGYNDEVFFANGWFWTRRGPVWYRARGPGAPFVMIDRRFVPAPVVALPPGHYRMYRAEERAERRAWRAEARRERRYEKAERKAYKEREKAERHERKDWEKAQRQGEHGQGHGHGHEHGRD